jgi:hypothetical protein
MLLCWVNGYSGGCGGLSVGKLLMGSLKSQTWWELINYYRIVRNKVKKGFIDVCVDLFF